MFSGKRFVRFLPLVNQHLLNDIPQPIISLSNRLIQSHSPSKYLSTLNSSFQLKSLSNFASQESTQKDTRLPKWRLQFIEALQNGNRSLLSETLKISHKYKATGFLCTGDADYRLVESNLLGIIPLSVLSGDPLLFSAVVSLLNFAKGISVLLVKEFLSLEDQFPKLSPKDIETPVNLLSLYRNSSFKVGEHTRKNVDQWMGSYLRSALAEKKITKMFTQLISLCGNSSLTMGHSTSIQLIDHMLVLISGICDLSNDNAVALATYLWYWKNTAHPVSHYSVRFYPAWELAAVKFGGKFNGSQCVMIVNALADQKLRLGDQFLHKLCVDMGMVHFRDSLHVANCLRSLAWVMKHHNFEQFHILKDTDIIGILLQQWHSFLKGLQLKRGQSLSNGIWAIAEFHPFLPLADDNFFEDFFQYSENILPVCNVQNLANILLALAKITSWNMIPTSWLKEFWKRYSVVLKNSTDQGLGNTYAALGFFDPSPTEFKKFPLEQMFDEVKSRVSNAGPIHLSQWVLHSGKLGIRANNMIEKSVARIIDLCNQGSISERTAPNLATGLSLLSCEIPSALEQLLHSNMSVMDTRGLLSVLDALTTQSSVLERPVSKKLVLSLASRMDLPDLSNTIHLCVSQTALAWFGADYFPKIFVAFMSDHQKTLRRLLQIEYNQHLKNHPSNTHTAETVEILSQQFPLLKLQRNKVIPEAACVVDVEVQDEERRIKWVLQVDGPGKYFYLPNGRCTFEERAHTQRNTKILEKAGYEVIRVRNFQHKDRAELIALFEKHFRKTI